MPPSSKPEPAPISEWLYQAEHDLDVARMLLAQKAFDWAAYAAQQAGEKAVKAVRLALGTPIKSIQVHDMDELLADIGRLHPKPDPILARVGELHVHNQGARYPGVRGARAPGSAYQQQHAEDAIRIADALYAFCEPLCTRIEEFWDAL